MIRPRPPVHLAPYAVRKRAPNRGLHARRLAACVCAGELAYAKGARPSDCPYTTPEARSAWCEGFTAAQRRRDMPAVQGRLL